MSQGRSEKSKKKKLGRQMRGTQRNVYVSVCVSGGKIREAISDCPSMSQSLCPL